MSSCSKTLGGAVPDQDTSEAITSHHLRSKKARTGSPPPTSNKILQANPYKSRLRPRPTKQTSLFVSSSPAQSKSTVKRPSECGPSGLNPKTKKPDVSIWRPSSKPVTKPAPAKSNPVKKFPASKVKLSTYSRPALGHRSPSRSEPPEKKLASNFGTPGETPEGFTEGPSTSKSVSGGKAYGSSKASSANKKSKVESKSHPLKKQPAGSKRAVSRKGVLGTTTKTSSSKTGSCASSRRGSERGKRSSAAAASSDHPSPPDDGNSRTADNQTTVRARHSQEARAQSSSLPENGETETSSGSRTQAAGGTAALSMDAATSSNNGDSEDADMTRLQQLLEARGLPPHFFGNLGPRMQQILHRSVGCGVNSKAQQHLQGLQAVGDESRQLQAAIGMCQLLVMGNEDTLAGFPIKSAVPALISLLRMEHNFDLMNHACRALTYMMEALPRSSAVIVDAIPVFLEKLQVIQCMDVAEQSLTALEMLSRRHAPAILAAGGQSACLLYIDFFSLPAQRSALSVAANCCLAVGTMSLDPTGAADEFERLVKSSLSLLSSRLTHHDKKCVESACLCFVRLIDNYQQDPDILAEIAGTSLFKNFQQLLVITPPLISSSTFVMVIRSMAVTCATVRSIANDLVKDDIAQTLLYLLCGTPPEKDTGQIELSHRSPQELFEITSLVGKLLPRLPKNDALFSINGVLWQSEGPFSDEKSPNRGYASWQWKDDDGQWRSYIRHDSKIIEAAHLAGEHEVNLTTLDRSYTVDFETMQQINDDTGTTRGIRRVLSKPNPAGSGRKSSKKQDAVKDKQEEEREPVTPEISNFIRTLFATLYEVYSSSAGSFAIRYECLHAIQRMVFCAEATLLSDVLQNLSMSSHISSMLSSPDVKVIVGALQLAEMLMKKLPKIFAEMFQREGVLHQLRKLTDPTHPIVGVNRKAANANAAENTLGAEPESPPSGASPASNSSVTRRVSPPLTKAKAFAAALTAKDAPSGAKKKTSRSSRGARSSTSSFFSGFNPTKWGRSASSSSNEAGNSEGPDASDAHKTKVKNSSKAEGSSHGPSKMKTGRYKESVNTGEINAWIQDRASKFLENYFSRNADNNNKQVGVLQRLTTVAKNLQKPDITSQRAGLEDLRSLVGAVDVSSFELQHSGLVTSLLHYLASTSSVDQEGTKRVDTGSTPQDSVVSASPKAVTFTTDLYSRIRLFLSVFASLPNTFLGKPEEAVKHIDPDQVTPLLNLVRKLSQCVGQLEQFPVKTHDLVSGGSQMLRVLSTRQLKCQLQRHPDCLKVKQWLGGPVKVDPLVQVQAIERYLLARGYGVKASRSSMSDVGKRLEMAMLQDQDDDSGDEIQDEDDDELSFEDNASECANNGAESSSMAFGYHMERHGRKASAGSLHTLEFYIGNNRLPHHITVLQAVEQYESSVNPSSARDEHDFAFKISENSGVWNKTHVIHYKLVPSKDEAPVTVKGNGKQKSSKKMKSVTKAGRVPAKQHKPSDQSWTEGVLPERQKCLDEYLVTKLPPEFTTPDACSEVLCLLRVIHAVSRYWADVYSTNTVYIDRQLVSSSEFINAKINAKCSRQSQDPLIIITGQLPTWLREVALACPFLLSFETRQQLFKITAFDRDRALQHLLDSGASQELSTVLSGGPNAGNGRAHGSSRFMPRLEKKKCSVSRKNLLQQAERIISDYAHLRAVVEVDYEGEVGTGLGPTLEFFTLTSKELQKSSLNMWREELVAGQEPAAHKEEVYAVSKQKVEGAESAVVFKMTDKDELIIEESSTSSIEAKSPEVGAAKDDKEEKDLINSPMGLFPKPLGRAAKLGQVGRINAKFRFLGKFLAKALMDGRMVDLPMSVAFYKWLLGGDLSFTDLDLRHVDPNFSSTFDKLKAVAQEYDWVKDSDADAAESVTMDGCPIEDLGFDMRLPGYANVELLKLGRNIPVTIHNLDRYLKLIVHWTLVEGVRRQMEALKEGFESVLPLHNLKFFFPEELDQFFCGSRYEQWSAKDLRDACHPDHGYTQDSMSVQRLYHVLSTYDLHQQRAFLQFVTGCPRLPVGGFGALNPRLTIVRKNCEEGENIDDYLPSVMTCLNYLKLPDYSTEDVMRSKLELAAVEGLNSFLLS